MQPVLGSIQAGMHAGRETGKQESRKAGKQENREAGKKGEKNLRWAHLSFLYREISSSLLDFFY